VKAHRTDLVSFVFGLLFVALAVWWLLAQLMGLALPPVGWFLAGALILIGLLGLVGALRSARHSGRETAPGATAEPSDGTPPGMPGAVPAGQPDVAAAGARMPAADRADADEWPTAAVADVPTEAVEDRPARDDGEPPHWSPTDPVAREEPVSGPPIGPDRAAG
jgi:hypothetical protein